LLFAAAPRLLSDYQLYTLNLIQVNILLAVGLNLVIGVTRQFALFSGALLGIGAYVAALLQMRLGVPFLLSVPVAVLATMAVSAAVSLVAWRAGGLYLAMITFGFGEVFQFILVHADAITNGPDGLAVPRPTLAGVAFAAPGRLFELFLPLTAIAIAGYRLMETGSLGRTMTALGDSEVALASVGRDPRMAKTIAFAIQGAYAGLAGAMFAAAVGFIDPYSFGLGVTLQQLTAIAVGGFGSLAGAVVGGAVLTLIERGVMDLPGVREIVYGLALLVVFLVFPTGLAGLFSRGRASKVAGAGR
jgi:branched-chain amino acid transport system permease protein